jgi:hypothetical protein
MVIACSKKKIGFNGETLAQTFLRHRLAANLTRLSKNLPSHQPIRLCLHTPHVLDHSLCSLFETALITHYLNFMLIDSSLQPDSESSICDETTCTRYFTYFTRRHHCRRCGNIFCDLHSLYTIPLDQDANYHPKGTRVRSCEHCWTDYRRWQIARSSRSNSESSHSEEPATPTVSCGKPRGAMSNVFGKAGGLSESIAASVPRDWNWSTF